MAVGGHASLPARWTVLSIALFRISRILSDSAHCKVLVSVDAGGVLCLEVSPRREALPRLRTFPLEPTMARSASPASHQVHVDHRSSPIGQIVSRLQET